MKRHVTFVVLILLPILGCGVQSARESARNFAVGYGEAAAPTAPAAKSMARPGNLVTDGSSSTVLAAGMMGGMNAAAQQPAADKLALSRKIIYDAQVDLVVKDVDADRQGGGGVRAVRGGLHCRAEHDRLSRLATVDALEASRAG